MRRATIYGRDVAMQGSPYTLLVYRTAFGGDLFRDVAAAYGETPPDVSVLLQAAWAMARTIDDSVSDYPDWLREFDPKTFALGDAGAWAVIDSAVCAELFRRKETGRIGKWIARRMGSVAKRLGALADRLLAR